MLRKPLGETVFAMNTTLPRCNFEPLLRASIGLKQWCLGLLLCFLVGPLSAQSLDFQEVFEKHSTVMLLIDPSNGQIVDANPAAVRFYGYTRDVLRNMTIQQINTLTDEQVAKERLLAEKEGRNYFIFRHILADGLVRTVEVRSHAFLTQGQRLLLSVVTDITPGRNLDQGMWHYQQRLEELVDERTAELSRYFQIVLTVLALFALLLVVLIFALRRLKQTKIRLSYRQALFGALFDQSGFLAGILDTEGRLLEVNRQALALINCQAADVLGREFADTAWWQEKYKARLRAAIASAVEGQPDQFETTHIGHDGQRVNVLFHAVPIDVGRDRYVSVIGVDITERKTLEQALKIQQRRLQAILDGTNVGTWEWNVQTGETTFNERWAEIIGYRLEDLQPVSIDTWLKFAHPDDLKMSGDLIEAHLSGKSDFYDCECRMRHKDGHWVWVHDRGRIATRSEDGQPLVMSGTHQDISERKRAELALLEAMQAAESANVAKSRFLATMSHEIRTPLNGVLGMAQLLLAAEVSQEERLDFAKTILHSGQALLTLLNDILDLAKVEAGKLALEDGIISPPDILHETQSLFSNHAMVKGLVLKVDWCGPSSAKYRGDAHRIGQMLSNLVTNAIKFTPSGVVHIEAKEVECDSSSCVLEFSVSDTGIGVEKDKLDLLFKPFSQADNSISRQFGGSGLGLSIVSSLAKLMGGEVGVESEPGQGSRFWFRIRTEKLPALSDLTLSATVVGASGPMFCGKVLVVEDNPTNQLIVVNLLKKFGLEALVAENGQLAVEHVLSGEVFDAILMDLNMPVMDGYEAAQRIRQWESSAGRVGVPIIALTADAFQEYKDRCLSCGMNDFLSKPIIVDDLVNSLSRWIAPTLPPVQIALKEVEAFAALDVPRFLALSETFLPLLEQAKFDAIDRFDTLESLAAGTSIAIRVHGIRLLVNAFSFDKAFDALTALRNELTAG